MTSSYIAHLNKMIHVFDDIFSNRKMYHFVHCCIDNPTHKMDIQILTVYMYMYEAPSLHFQTAKNSIKITHQQNVNMLHIVKGWETCVHYLKNIFKRFLRNLVVRLHLLLL